DDVNAFRFGPSTHFREQLGRFDSLRPDTQGGVTDKAHEDADKLLAAHLAFAVIFDPNLDDSTSNNLIVPQSSCIMLCRGIPVASFAVCIGGTQACGNQLRELFMPRVRQDGHETFLSHKWRLQARFRTARRAGIIW